MSSLERNELNGWLVIDKPYELGSTQVVSRLKWALSPTKIGHAGTLDPLATGVLPIALGQATRLIPYVMDGHKVYEFQITWGTQTDTDDATGAIIKTSENRPQEDEIRAVLPAFIGEISQLPPAYSALKINGQRAYDLARSGEKVVLQPRLVRIEALELCRLTPNTADFRVKCGKGTYVRSLGRDIGARLGCLGHITALRRTECGPFGLQDATDFGLFSVKGPLPMGARFLPLETALDALPTITVDRESARRLSQGQRLPLRQLSSLPLTQETGATERVVRLIHADELCGLVKISRGILHPFRMFKRF